MAKNPLLGPYTDLRSMSEDTACDLRAAVEAYWQMARNAGIGDVLLLRACDKLGILPEGVDLEETIEKWKV